MTAPDDYVIWSYEHDAWWGRARLGYTPNLLEAGRYSHAEAAAIVAKANITGCMHEAMLSLHDVLTRRPVSAAEMDLLHRYALLSPAHQAQIDALLTDLADD